MDIEEKVANAQVELNAAIRRVHEFERQIAHWIEEATKKIKSEHQPHLTNLRNDRRDLESALTALLDERASSKPHPLEGKRMTRTSLEGGSYFRREVRLYGVFETVTSKSIFAQNTPSWRKPNVGFHIVRLLRKDGSTGIKWEIYNDRSDWVPVS